MLAEWVVRLGTWVPVGQIPRLLADFAGVTLSAETVRCQTEAAGALVVAAATAAAPARAPPADPGPATLQRLPVSPDGAFVRVQRVLLGNIVNTPIVQQSAISLQLWRATNMPRAVGAGSVPRWSRGAETRRMRRLITDLLLFLTSSDPGSRSDNLPG